MTPEGEVAHYYDRNTPRFLLVGGGRRSLSIHRQLWGPGVSTVDAASNYINRLIADEIRALALARPPFVLDMGCGVGGTLFHLGEALPGSRLVGITISPKQYRVAVRAGVRRSTAGSCEFLLGDFQTLRIGQEADVAVAVESFVHSDSVGRFFAAAARYLRRPGYLILADDFLSVRREALDTGALDRVRELEAGWRLSSLCTVDSCVSEARRAGFQLTKSVDLSGLIRLGRPRDRLIARLSPLLRRLDLTGIPFFANMIGGNALQAGLREGFLGYHLLVFSGALMGPSADTDVNESAGP